MNDRDFLDAETRQRIKRLEVRMVLMTDDASVTPDDVVRQGLDMVESKLDKIGAPPAGPLASGEE